MTGRIDPEALKTRSYYSHAVAKRGVPLFLTGQVAWDASGAIVGIGDIHAQIGQVWANLRDVVVAVGAELTTFATSRDFVPALHAERAKHFNPGAFPASTFIEVAGLAEADLLVEVEAILMLPETHPVFSAPARTSPANRPPTAESTPEA
jgi:enamine deaminase RidA (YjgF/YER057c/UK114 family)